MTQKNKDNYVELYNFFEEKILARAELISQKTAGYFDAEDIAQELFLKLFLELDRYDAKRGEIENFFNKVLMNARKDIVKKAWAKKNGLRERRVYLDQAVFDQRRDEFCNNTLHDIVSKGKGGREDDEAWLLEMLKMDILEVLEHPSLISDRQMILWYLCGYRQTEIAERMQCSQSNVSIKLKQFRTLLAKKMEEDAQA